MSHHVEWRCALVRHLSSWRLQTYQHMRPAAFRWLQGFSELQKFLMHHWLMNSYWFTIIPALRTLKVLMTISKHLLAEAYFLALGHLQIKLYSVISAPSVQLRSSEWKQSHIVPEPQYVFSQAPIKMTFIWITLHLFVPLPSPARRAWSIRASHTWLHPVSGIS